VLATAEGGGGVGKAVQAVVLWPEVAKVYSEYGMHACGPIMSVLDESGCYSAFTRFTNVVTCL
jgi:hypothetical protein